MLKSTVARAVTMAMLSALLFALCLVLYVAGAEGAPDARCSNEMYLGFRFYLPDCRAYELVTPSYKEAMTVISVGGLSQDGSRLIVQGFGSFVGVESQTTFGAVYILNRGTAGWQATPLNTPAISTYPRFEETVASNSLTGSLWDPTYPDQPTDDIYLRSEDGAFYPVGPGGPLGASQPRLIFAGASADLSHVVFTDRAPITPGSETRLWPGDTTEGELEPSLYEYVGTGNDEPHLVGVSNEGSVARVGDSHLISRCGTVLGNPEGDAYNAISQTGSTVFFTALGLNGRRACREISPQFAPAVSELYARIDDAHTVAISEPELGACSCNLLAPADAQFRGASSDGSKVFFTTTQQLLPGATGGGPYLYEYDFEAPEGKKITLVSAGDANGPRVQGVARVSEDGSHVYFVAKGVLTGEQNIYGEKAEEGEENLYAFVRECPGGSLKCTEPQQQLSFVGRLSEEADSEDWAGFDLRPVQATPDGRFLVFRSAADLTPDEEGRKEAGQMFEFDAQTGALVRVSRGVDGYNEDGNSNIYPVTIPNPGYFEDDYPESRFVAVSANGAYVFFMSSDGLSPDAVTGHSSVYEYHAGEVSLVSDGHDLSAEGSRLLGADESGQDVFFTSDDSLVPQDVDTQEDIYDARIGGGFAAQPVQSGCSEDTCQGPLAGAFQPPTPTTPSSAGEGGAVPAASSTPASVTAKRTKAKAKAKKQRRKHTRTAKRAAKSKRR